MTENNLNKLYKLLDQKKQKEAKDLATKLISLNVKEAYIVLAEILEEESKTPQVVSLLQKATGLFPDWLLLWHKLGLNLFYLEDYCSALIALDKALNLHNAQGKYDQHIIASKLEVLACLDKYEEIIKVGDQNLNNTNHSESEESYDCWSRIFYCLALSNWKLNQYEDIISYLEKSLQLNRFNENALWLFREFNKSKSLENSKYFVITIEANWSDEFQSDNDVVVGFITSYDVVADSEEEGLQIIKDFEIDKDVNISSIVIIEVETLENPNDLKGIYRTYPFQSYEEA